MQNTSNISEPRESCSCWQSCRIALGVAALLVLFAGLSYCAVLGKSACFDEPGHALAGYVYRFYGDTRVAPEDPPLMAYLAGLPHTRSELKLDLNDADYVASLKISPYRFGFVTDALYRTPGNDPDRFLNRSRLIFVMVGVMAGALLAWWSWKLAGGVAALAATAAFALDPNFLGHAALVDSDVPATLTMLALTVALWQFGRSGSLRSLAFLVLIVVAGLNVKFSAVLFGPIVLVALFARALLPQPWTVLGRTLATPGRRLLVVPLVMLLVGVATWAGTWALYGFRYSATPDPRIHLSRQWEIDRIRDYQRLHPDANAAPSQRAEDARLPLPMRAAQYADAHRLMPEAWLAGFMHIYAGSLQRAAFLMGKHGSNGWWYFFPLAMLFKTPLATLVALGLAPVVWVLSYRAARAYAVPVDLPAMNEPTSEISSGFIAGSTEHAEAIDPHSWRRLDTWTLACIAAPVLVYGFSALTAKVDIGHRHVLPLYPFLYLAVGIAVTRLIQLWPRNGRMMAGGLLVALAVEALTAFPNYVAFFNAGAGGSRGGLALLSDSSLDWGQDLRLLAAWQRENPDTKLYLCYFGLPDPAYYGIRYTNLPGGYRLGPKPQNPTAPGVIAISATNLQGTALPEPLYKAYQRTLLERETPRAVLGGTIYLFDFPPRAEMASTAE